MGVNETLGLSQAPATKETPMFDLLTTSDLYKLHADLFADATSIHESIMDEKGQPRISVFSEDWLAASRLHTLICDAMEEVEAEATRRYDLAHADA
jgi:hypothetical protein